jgi:uncharacterized membrane protein YjjP (DUF1212 family)
MPRTKKDEALIRLKRIEGKIDDLGFLSLKQWLAALGFGFVIGSFAMVSQNFEFFLTFLIIGVLLLLLARFLHRFLPRRKGKL